MGENDTKLGNDFAMDELSELSPDALHKELVRRLESKAKEKGNKLTYGDVTDYLENLELDKNVVDEIYDSLMSRDIEIEVEDTDDDFG